MAFYTIAITDAIDCVNVALSSEHTIPDSVTLDCCGDDGVEDDAAADACGAKCNSR